MTVDARGAGRNWCAYANDARDPARINLVARIEGSRVVLRTKRAIAAGAELYLDYGRLFWLEYDLAHAAGRAPPKLRAAPKRRVASFVHTDRVLRSHASVIV